MLMKIALNSYLRAGSSEGCFNRLLLAPPLHEEVAGRATGVLDDVNRLHRETGTGFLTMQALLPSELEVLVRPWRLRFEWGLLRPGCAALQVLVAG